MTRLLLMANMRKVRGAGLVEVLVGLLVISLGVAGLARFHAVVMRESGSARARSVAVQLARAKLDDLRGFVQLARGDSGVFGYDELADNAGGAETAEGGLHLPAGELSVGSLRYQRSWTASAYYYCVSGAAADAFNCTPPKSRADYQALAVTIAWVDADGAARSIVLRDTASSMDPASVALAMIPGAAVMPPIVAHRPAPQPSAIRLDVGAGQRIEVSEPIVTLNTEAEQLINTLVRYEIVRYDEQGNTLAREQFTTLNCLCRQLGVGSGVDLQGAPVGKRIGAAADAAQAFECGVCCRDHHDDARCEPGREAGRRQCYDPDRPVEAYDSGSHDHHHYSASGAAANGVGEVYAESCRLQRIDGGLRVAQDWRLIRLDVIPQTYFAPDGVPDPERAAAYGDYVKRYVAAAIGGDPLPAGPWRQRESLAAQARLRLVSRGIYLAPLDNASRAAWAARLRAGEAAAFQSLPFYVLDLSRFAQWSSSAPAIATVSDLPPNDGSVESEPSARGLVRGIAPGTATISVRMRIGNRGFGGEGTDTDTGTLNSSIAERRASAHGENSVYSQNVLL